MYNKKKRDAFYRLFFSKDNTGFSLADFLNDSSCDEIIDIDLNKDTYRVVSHREGKYFVPPNNKSYKLLFKFTYDHVVHIEDREAFFKLMNPDDMLERLENSNMPHFTYDAFRYKMQSGEYRYVEQCLVTGKENGLNEGVVRFYVFDTENRNVRYSGITRNDSLDASTYDPITGLLVARPFFEQVRYIITEYPNVDWCIVSLDISKFKVFEQWYGHETANSLLSKIGEILTNKEYIGDGVAGYFGLDNFSILMSFDMEIIKKIEKELRETITSLSNSSGFLPIIGVAKVEADKDIVLAFDHSNIAAAKAKSEPHKYIWVYGPELQNSVDREMQILGEFMDAMKNNEITFYLQPQCRISSRCIVGAEALCRWIKRNGEMISPGVFIPLLEKHGFIIDLDKYLWDKICAWIHKQIQKGITPVPISINVSQADIFSINIVDYFESLCRKYQISPQYLKIEITESAYADITTVVTELVKNLREKGFMVLMDDFGSGYSSLNMLSSLEMDAIKLDAKFIDIDETGKSFDKGIHILESVINMAKIISLPIIVEGVENKKQCDFLEGLGCRYIQGYYFYRPMPKEEMEKLLSNPDNVDYRGFVMKRNEQLRIREFLDKNIYSDSMLNNILGAVAFYSYHDRHVDIERFNEQFYKIVGVQEIHERLNSIEQFIVEEDVDDFLNLYDKAVEDKLNGSTGIVRFKKPTGAILSMQFHLYYLGEESGHKRFYGAIQNATELMETKQQLAIMSDFARSTIVFLRKFNDVWSTLVASYSLSDDLQMSKEEFQALFDNHQLYKLFASRGHFDNLHKKIKTMIANNQTFTISLKLLNHYREAVPADIKFAPVPDQSNNIKYIIQIVSH